VRLALPDGPVARLLLGYAATRVAALLMLAFLEASLFVEPLTWLQRLDSLGPSAAFPEYPWPAVALLHLPMRLGIPTYYHYFAAVVLFMLLVDAAFTWLLWRAGGRSMNDGLRLWLLVFVALGPLLVTRFDLLPGVLMATALLALQRDHHAAAGVLAALGCGFKAWPVLGVPALLLPGAARSRTALLGSLLGTGVLLAAATAAAAGLQRLWSPLATQLGRGLQIEAVPGLPLLWLRYFDGGVRWTLPGNAECNCHEIAGPGVEAALQAGTVAALVCVAAIAWLHVRAALAPPGARTAALAATLATVTVLLAILTSRVFSPQYLIWVAALLAALGTLPGGMLTRRDLILFVAACVCTQLVFPLGFFTMLDVDARLHVFVLLALTLRDALLIALALRLARRAWGASARAAAPA
jgi:hypothetical protein